MPAPKGSYNTGAFHAAAAEATEVALRNALRSLGSGTVFLNVSSLASHLAMTCGRTAGQLRRNRRYRVILEEHIARQSGAVGAIGDRIPSAPILMAKLTEARLRISLLEQDRIRLQAFIKKHEVGMGQSAARSEGKADDDAKQYRQAFECTAAALDAVLLHAEVYEVDLKSGSLVDLASRPGSPPVAGPHLLSEFILWRKRKKMAQ